MSAHRLAPGALTADEIVRARERIGDLIRPLRAQPAGEIRRDGAEPWIKDETRQPTGSFKIRGAAHALRCLPAGALARGVVAVSTGNHGRAVAHVARELGARATVFVSNRVPGDKLDALRDAGAELVVHGASQDEAEDAARAHADRHGATLIPPFDHPDVITGQGTIGAELLEEVPGLRTVVVPLSGGGLIAGVATAVKAADATIRVIGVSMEAGAVMHASLKHGAPVELAEADTLADSLQGGLGRGNRYTFAAVRERVDDVVLVGEAALAEAMRHLFRHHRIVAEGGGAAALAAVLVGRAPVSGPTAVVVSGGNVAADAYARVLAASGPPGGGAA